MEICNISKKYKDHQVLKNVTFSVSPGECVALLGSNGSGKSTLLSVLSGIARADGGSFMYEEQDLLCNPSLREQLISYVPQGNPLYEELSARDNLRLWYTGEQLQEQLSPGGTLETLEIQDFLNKKVRTLSGGMKKRLSIGCCVAGNPKLLLLDEPSASLDLVCKAKIHSYLNAFKNRGGSVLIVSHDLMDLEICDSFYLLKGGQVQPLDYKGDAKVILDRL